MSRDMLINFSRDLQDFGPQFFWLKISFWKYFLKTYLKLLLKYKAALILLCISKYLQVLGSFHFELFSSYHNSFSSVCTSAIPVYFDNLSFILTSVVVFYSF